MKKRLAELAQPPPAVLSHGALNLAALYRSVSQVKKRSVRRRRSKVSIGNSTSCVLCTQHCASEYLSYASSSPEIGCAAWVKLCTASCWW